jgi:hypothetical protein
MENTKRQTIIQKQKGYLTDHELIEVARAALREIFSQKLIETSTIEVRYSVKSLSDMVDDDDDMTTSIWFVHHGSDDDIRPGDITRATIRLWDLMQDRGDLRQLSMYHGYKSDPLAVQQAA